MAQQRLEVMNRMVNIFRSLFRGAGELSPNCREVSRLQSEALDHPLPFAQKLGLRIHLFLCKWCRRYGRHIHFLRNASHDHDGHEHNLPRQSLRHEARERIKERLKADNKTS